MSNFEILWEVMLISPLCHGCHIVGFMADWGRNFFIEFS